jgi:hypothetical protein
MHYAFGCTHDLEETKGPHNVTPDEMFDKGHEPAGEILR